MLLLFITYFRVSDVSDARVSITNGGRKLTIRRVTHADAGTYRVTVDNKRASPSSMMELVVLGERLALGFVSPLCNFPLTTSQGK